MNTSQTYTASEARRNFYSLLKEVSEGLESYEIILRGEKDPVMLINKKELEAWQETLDILTSPLEMKAIRAGKKQKKSTSHETLLKSLGILHESGI